MRSLTAKADVAAADDTFKAFTEFEHNQGTRALARAWLHHGLRAGERACLVGRNGCGKSTLLKALGGSLPLDHGERFLQPGTRVAYLPQDPTSDDPDFAAGSTVKDYVTRGQMAAFLVRRRVRSDGLLHSR